MMGFDRVGEEVLSKTCRMRQLRGWKSAPRGRRRQSVIFIRIVSLPFIRTETADLKRRQVQASNISRRRL